MFVVPVQVEPPAGVTPCNKVYSEYYYLPAKMQAWLKISLQLSIFGFLKEIRPSEPFIYEYLVGPWRNITDEQVQQEVYPVGTYSYLAQLIIVFLITDFLRYKPLIVVSGIMGIAVWTMLTWTTGLLELQLLEVIFKIN